MIGLGAAAAIWAAVAWQPVSWLRFASYMAVAIPGAALKVRLPRVTGTMSVMFIFLLAGIVDLGLAQTLLMSAVCVVVQSYWRAKHSPRLIQVLFSIAVMFLACTAAYLTYRNFGAGWLAEGSPFRLAATATVLFVVNTWCIAMVIGLTERRNLGQVWREFYGWSFPYYLIGAGLVGVFSVASHTLNWQSWVLILPSVYAIYRSYYLYLERLEHQSQRAEEEGRHAAEVAELLQRSMETNRALKRANEDLEQFAYAASHDLQEPLRMIAIYSELLERRHASSMAPDARILLGTIMEGSHRINELVRDLLSYTSVGAAEQAAPAPTDPTEIVAEVRRILHDRIAETGATIVTGTLPPVRAHRTQLLQLLQNLISNSLKYRSEERRPQVEVRAWPAADGMIHMAVSDNGVGVQPEYHDRIFGVFRRLHSRSIAGNGIGLAICRKIVQNHGGSIWIESDGSSGSTFHFTLPAAAELRSGRPDDPAPKPMLRSAHS